jgi:hypothetical protein
MKPRYFSLLLLLICPLTVFAHGQEVLVTFVLELASILIFVTALVAVDLNGKGKLIVGGIYLVTTIVMFMGLELLPHREYQTIINIIVVVFPFSIGFISYIKLREKFQKD